MLAAPRCEAGPLTNCRSRLRATVWAQRNVDDCRRRWFCSRQGRQRVHGEALPFSGTRQCWSYGRHAVLNRCVTHESVRLGLRVMLYAISACRKRHRAAELGAVACGSDYCGSKFGRYSRMWGWSKFPRCQIGRRDRRRKWKTWPQQKKNPSRNLGIVTPKPTPSTACLVRWRQSTLLIAVTVSCVSLRRQSVTSTITT